MASLKSAGNKVSGKPNQQENHPSPLLILLLSLIVGFFGGTLGVRLYSDEQTQQTNLPTNNREIVLLESEVISDVAEQVNPSVVSISVESLGASNFFFDAFVQQGAGTGIVLSKDGLILTNKHVIPVGVRKVTVITADGKEYSDVEVLGRDPFNDVAFIKVNGAKDFVPATLGDSDNVRVGDKVLAIGNALGQFQNTVTFGIISGISRPVVATDGFNSENLQNLLQTDAAINPGNSGGPLVNILGEVIGMNTAVAGGAENIGFAIPINDVKPGIESIEKHGRLVKPYLGVRYITIDRDVAERFELPVDYGAYILPESVIGSSSILPGSPAEKAGLKEGDIILKVNGEKVDQSNELPKLINKYQVGDKIELEIMRDDQTITLEATLEAAPENL